MAKIMEQDSEIQQLRELVEKQLPVHMTTDLELKKWLMARNNNAEKAEVMLQKHLEWRQELDINNISSWKPPEVVVKYYPVGFTGYDKTGVPVWIVPFGNCDMRGILNSCSRRDFILYALQLLEKALDDIRKRNEGQKDPITTLSCIYDMENFSLRHISWKPAMDTLLQLAQMYESNYPEILKTSYVINAPRMFIVAFAIFKPFLDETTLNKIKIFGKTGWQEAILNEISPDQLPAYYNGTLTDLDGNPKCLTKVCYGGEVPRSFYQQKKKITDGDKNMLKTLVLANGCKENFELEVIIPGTELRWEFQSDDFDIGFGISRLLTAGREDQLLPLQRVNSQLVPEEGRMVCSDPGTYQITFDNEYSYLRSKTLYYKLELFEPTEHTKF